MLLANGSTPEFPTRLWSMAWGSETYQRWNELNAIGTCVASPCPFTYPLNQSTITAPADRPLAKGWAISENPVFGTWLMRIEAGLLLTYAKVTGPGARF